MRARIDLHVLDPSASAHRIPEHETFVFCRVPQWITPSVAAEAKKRLKEDTFTEIMALLPLVTKVLRRALTDPEVDAKTKLDAVKFLVDHATGRAMQRTAVELSGVEKVQQIFASAIVLDDGHEDTHLVIDGEATEYTGHGRKADRERDDYE
jgi:hypothetical protein